MLKIIITKNKIMIEIKKRNKNWELYVDGALLGWNENLSVVVDYLHSHIEYY